MLVQRCARVAPRKCQQARHNSIWMHRGMIGNTVSYLNYLHEPPRRPLRDPSRVDSIKKKLDNKVTFITTPEYELITKNRLNTVGEFTYQRDARMEASRKLSAAVQEALDVASKSSEDIPVYQFWDHIEDVHDILVRKLEDDLDWSQRLHDTVYYYAPVFFDGLPHDVARMKLPNNWTNVEHGLMSRAIKEWMPPKYQQTYAPDIQSVAAFDPQARKEMIKAIDDEKAAFLATANPSEKAMVEEMASEMKAVVDPTAEITAQKISAATTADELREMATAVYQYNWDSRVVSIYRRSADLAKEGKASRKLLDTLGANMESAPDQKKIAAIST